MTVIAVAGLPGSGKSRLTDELQQQGYTRYNDINRDWGGNLPHVRTEAQQGKNIVISDIIFCDEAWRRKLENEIGLSVQWIFFENNLWQCAKNCLHRFMFEKRHRPLQKEIRKICELSALYRPYGDIRPVVRADENIPQTWPGVAER